MLKPNPFKHKQPKIIDVSHWEGRPGTDGRPDWEYILNQDDAPSGVILKATDYYGNLPRLDTAYIHNYTQLKYTLIKRGAYHYFNPEFDAAKQAYHFCKIINSDPGYYPPALDLEKRDYKDRNGKWVRMPRGNAMAAKVHQYLEIVEYETGRIPMIYSSENYIWEYMRNWKGQNALGDANRFYLWLAQYPRNPDLQTKPTKLPIGWTSCYIWQYSEAGVLKGFPYDGVDLNVLLEGSVPTEPPIPHGTKMVVTSNARPYLNVRELPLKGSESVGRLYFGDVVTVTDTQEDGAGNLWAQIGVDSWCAITYNGIVYLQEMK